MDLLSLIVECAFVIKVTFTISSTKIKRNILIIIVYRVSVISIVTKKKKKKSFFTVHRFDCQDNIFAKWIRNVETNCKLWTLLLITSNMNEIFKVFDNWELCYFIPTICGSLCFEIIILWYNIFMYIVDCRVYIYRKRIFWFILIVPKRKEQRKKKWLGRKRMKTDWIYQTKNEKHFRKRKSWIMYLQLKSIWYSLALLLCRQHHFVHTTYIFSLSSTILCMIWFQ